MRPPFRLLPIVALLPSLLLASGCKKEGVREEPPAQRTREVTVDPGWAFETALSELEAPPDLSQAIIKALKGTLDFRRCQPGDRAMLLTAKNGEFLRFEYHQGPRRYYLVEARDSVMVASEVEFETQQRLNFFEGEITRCLSESVKELGETEELANLLSDIFAWDIDFSVETRKGDRFTVLVMKEYIEDSCVGYGPILYATYSGNVGNHEATRFEDSKGRADHYDRRGQSLRKMFLRSPIQYRRISSYFTRSRYHPILKKYRPHHGVDYIAPRGAAVSSIGTGTVVFAGWKGGYGRLVTVRHPKGFQSSYGHLSGFGKGIRAGARVNQGQTVGFVGSTGLSTGPHLHFELKQHGSFVNPLRIRIPAADPVSEARMTEFNRERENVVSIAKAYDLLGTMKDLADVARQASNRPNRQPASN